MFRRIHAAPVLCALIMLLAFPLALTGQEATQDESALPAELRAARTSLNEAFDKLDGAAATSHFTDTGVVEFNGQVMSGKAAVGGWFAEALSGLSALRGGTSTFTIADGVVMERASYTAVTRDGSQQEGRSETEWKLQEDGSWKITRLIVL